MAGALAQNRRQHERLQESEARFRDMADAVPVLLWESAAGKGCVWFNGPWLDFTGRSLAEECGEGWTASVHPEDLAQCLSVYETAFDARQPFTMEYRLRHRDGRYRWILDRGVPRFEPGGGFVGYIGSAVDIDALRQTQGELEAARLRLSAVLENLLEGVVLFDRQGNFQHFNPAALALTELRVDEIKRPLKDFIRQFELRHPSDGIVPFENWPVMCVLRGETFTDYELEQRRLDTGSAKVLSYSGRLVKDAHGREFMGLVTLRDITEKKRLEAALHQANENLEQQVAERTAELSSRNEQLLSSNEELQQFAYIAAHDLQSPLRSIAGFAQLLQKKYQARHDAEADAWTERLVSAALRMQDLITNLQKYSQVDSRGGRFEPTDMNEVFRGVVGVQEATIRQTDAQVTSDDLPVVLGDPIQLGQVLLNLIDNGLKYRGRDPPRVHVSAALQQNDWLFSVRDNGIGIPETQWRKIFEIFRRLHTQEAYPGTGLGLALCRRIIHRHGGRIWVASHPGQGSTFYFTLPVHRQDPGDEATTGNSGQPAA